MASDSSSDSSDSDSSVSAVSSADDSSRHVISISIGFVPVDLDFEFPPNLVGDDDCDRISIGSQFDFGAARKGVSEGNEPGGNFFSGEFGSALDFQLGHDAPRLGMQCDQPNRHGVGAGPNEQASREMQPESQYSLRIHAG